MKKILIVIAFLLFSAISYAAEPISHMPIGSGALIAEKFNGVEHGSYLTRKKLTPPIKHLPTVKELAKQTEKKPVQLASGLMGIMGGASAAATWTPASLTSPLLWIEADTEVYEDAGTTLCVANNCRVAQWNDLIAANDLSQGTAAQKPYFTTNTINGKPSIYFDNANNQIDSNQAGNQKPVSIAMVVRSPEMTSGSGVMLAGHGGTGGISVDMFSKRIRLVQEDIALVGGSNTDLADNTWYLVIITYASDGAYAITINGADHGTGTTNLTFTDRGTRLGRNQSGVVPFYGNIAALVKTGAVMTADEKTSLTSYWQAKYAIY